MKGTPHVFRFVRPILALLIVAASFAFMFVLAYHPIPTGNGDTINLVVGFMLGITATVGAYYFGTSKDKSDGEQMQRSPNTATVTKTEEIKP